MFLFIRFALLYHVCARVTYEMIAFFHVFVTRCQPWTITLTGVLAITGSWLILHSVVVTAIVLLLICTWWYIFLYSYPKVWVTLYLNRCSLDAHTLSTKGYA